MSEEERFDVVRNACPGAGACGGMYTANTMASAIEALGMSLPYSSSTPAHALCLPARPLTGQDSSAQSEAMQLESFGCFFWQKDCESGCMSHSALCRGACTFRRLGAHCNHS